MNRPQTDPGKFLAPFLDPGTFSRETAGPPHHHDHNHQQEIRRVAGVENVLLCKPNSARFSPRSSSTVNRLLSIDSHANACLWIIAREPHNDVPGTPGLLYIVPYGIPRIL
ncbi:hypothetical protein BDP55DRAFT_340676 [Colletotrichum godetiae]|uniref:Uncharacterized protein n=1 Tax=Colletotrichum godetiae TaxID=1209918 RepID=A0AAJ0ATP3_9PEZI|nr:uncharacterized protein BDP55DRAFT_340676 [Colletotrichum godetiae]KAK1690172.1 hypothetical protein BDP55DRAFT_340676 [Colletotrichum godetiae]